MRFRFAVPAGFLLAAALSCAAFGQSHPIVAAEGGHLIVTAEGRHGAAPPEVRKDDVQVQVDRHPAPVEDWVALRGDQANLELYVVIDDGDDSDLALQFGDLRNFMSAQPASTKMGLAYLQNGAARIVAPLTSDCAQVAKALRAPLAQPGISASPFMGISDLIAHWPAANARREILLIASGIDPWSPPDPENIYLQKAIADAQRAGIVVQAIYYPEAGHLGHSYWRVTWGQNYLSELTDETGGDMYWQGTIRPVSFAPFLKDMAMRLENQYLLTVNVPAGKHGLQPVHVEATLPGVSLTSASKINAH